jgi:hypothetical protein
MTDMTKPKRTLAAATSAPQPALLTPAPEPPDDPCAPPPLVYDPADYRWVPVRRKPRYSGWTEEKQRRFIEALADTGQVGLAARAVGMSRETAYALRRQPHAAAFARAWDAARGQAGSLIEDVAFERALEGVEHNVYDERGDVVCTKRVYNDRLLMFLLRSLKPERYARHALATLQSAEPKGATIEAEPCAGLTASLAALEPPLPGAELLDPETLDAELEIAEIMDGKLPSFLSEQREARPQMDPAKAARLEQVQRGEEIDNTLSKKRDWSDAEFADWCAYHEAFEPQPRSRKRYR